MNITIPDYTYKVLEVVKVIDGDTVDVIIDLGFHINILKRIRFLEIDTYEMRGGTAETKALANQAKDRLVELLTGPRKQVYIRTQMDDTGKYGRLLGKLFVLDQEDDVMTDVNQVMLAEGFVEYKN
jgi:micrococcal nuclease